MKKIPKKLLENLANEFWDMRAKFKRDILEPSKDIQPLWFDYPNYYDLSKKISWRLDGDFVDSLQGDFFYEMEVHGLLAYKKFFKSKRDLHRHIVRLWKIYGFCD